MITRRRLKPENILTPHSVPVVAVVQRLREIVKRTMTQAEERAYPRHPRASYRKTAKGSRRLAEPTVR